MVRYQSHLGRPAKLEAASPLSDTARPVHLYDEEDSKPSDGRDVARKICAHLEIAAKGIWITARRQRRVVYEQSPTAPSGTC